MSPLAAMPTPLTVAPGSIVEVRDEEWLVTAVETTPDGQLLKVQGLSDLVRGTTASFYESIDAIHPLDPAETTPVADDSPHYRCARLWLEATLRKIPIPLSEPKLAVSQFALADPLEYQYAAVRQALSPDNLQPRILLADAVGLGKTLEIGMILAELIRRGRGDRILVVCPRHVLEQMQHEMWCRFAIPFVRLDSVGVQRVKQKLPANRNPFTYFKRVIISMDTLKQDRFVHDLRRHHWDAVVIDESHNMTNTSTQNNALARSLAPNTDALILASATPHNGRKESFAELIRLLEPTAVNPHGEINRPDLSRLVIRRHRNSPEVASVAGADWAEREEPRHILVPASPAEDAVASELADVWLHPKDGNSPYSGHTSSLFPWTLAKAFLSSPAALAETITERLKRIAEEITKAAEQERAALTRLLELNALTLDGSGKYDHLVKYLRTIKVGKGSPERAVVFSERVATLGWLARKLRKDLGLPVDAVEVLHGGMGDSEQQKVVDEFKQSNTPVRILVTGDVASEGVNLHSQCHELIHFDIPWSLIRIEQRNGRIDRYGQKKPPQITTLLLEPSAEGFAGDVRVLSRLLERENEAHTALGDAAGLMGKYDVAAEEEEIKKVLAGQRGFDDVVMNVAQATSTNSLAALLAALNSRPVENRPEEVAERSPLYPGDVDFLREALQQYFQTPSASPAKGGVGWQEHRRERLVELVPPPDLQQRLDVLPQSYLADRKVRERLVLAVDPRAGTEALRSALSDANASSWPEAHYLGPLHPVLDWAADRALASLTRNQVYAIRGAVEHPTVLVVGTLTDQRGLVVAASWFAVAFPFASGMVTPYGSSQELLRAVGLTSAQMNPGPLPDTEVESLAPLIGRALNLAAGAMARTVAAAEEEMRRRVAHWSHKTAEWQDDADTLISSQSIKVRRVSVQREEELAQSMAPDRPLLRPLLVVAAGGEGAVHAQ